MMDDPLNSFDNVEACPDCGCLTRGSTLRCPECGLFHYDVSQLPERDPPPPVEEIGMPNQTLDPLMYSLNPHSAIPEERGEKLEYEDPTVNWKDSSTTFALLDEEE